jgi:hypothetical protein
MSRHIKDIDTSTIVFSKQKINSSNKFLYVYSEKKPLILKLGLSRLPFGLQKDNLSRKPQYIVDFSMEKAKDTLEAFENLDKTIISKVHSEFFPEKSLEEVTSMYTSYLKYPEDQRYSPTLRAKIIIDDEGKPKCDFYESEKDENGKYPKIDVVAKGNGDYLLTKIGKGASIEGIIECIGLWFFGNKFGLSFKVTQVLVHPKTLEPPKKEETCQFIDSESDTSNSDADFLGE